MRRRRFYIALRTGYESNTEGIDDLGGRSAWAGCSSCRSGNVEFPEGIGGPQRFQFAQAHAGSGWEKHSGRVRTNRRRHHDRLLRTLGGLSGRYDSSGWRWSARKSKTQSFSKAFMTILLHAGSSTTLRQIRSSGGVNLRTMEGRLGSWMLSSMRAESRARDNTSALRAVKFRQDKARDFADLWRHVLQNWTNGSFALGLLFRNPFLSASFQQIQRQRASVEHLVVKASDIKFRAQGLLRAVAKLTKFELTQLVAQGLCWQRDVAIGLRLDGGLVNSAGLAHELHHLIARPSFRVDSGVDHQAHGTQELGREPPIVRDWILVKTDFF